MKLGLIKAVSKKEVKHLIRDYRMLFVLLFFPLFLLIIFGYAVNFDVHHIATIVYDQDKSDVSRDFIKSILSSDYFDFSGNVENERDIKTHLDRRQAQLIVVIPNDFSRKYFSNKNVNVQFLIDGVDGNTATIIQNYVNLASAEYNKKLSYKRASKLNLKLYNPVSLEPVFWFNPDLNTSKFLVPGLIAMILIITSVISVSLSLVREKERGTIEQIKISSIGSIELLLGKTIPYFILALFNAIMILILSYFLFGLVIKGNAVLLFFSTVIFLISTSSLGIFISVVANSQQVAFSIGTFSTLLPSVILSGFVFPIESMPGLIQLLTNITPAKFYIVIIRAVLLRGVGIEAFWPQLIYLLLFAGVFLILASLINRKKL